MQRLTLTLKLLDPLVLSQSNATVGLHQSLDYIPGATFLGAIASKHYAAFKKENLAHTLFHSGEVRFHNARILYQNTPTYPVPLSYHHIKGGNKNVIKNLLIDQIGDWQPKQHRKGYLTQDKKLIKPKKTTHLRTAIDPKKGTAAEGQLFGYQALAEGITLQTHIDFDNTTGFEALKAKIKKNDILHIGRSRSAHYGRIQITDIKEDTASFDNYPTIDLNGETHLVLWLASDLAAYDQNGTPTLFPNLKDLGLSIDAEPTKKTYIRTRTYAPYNGYRRSYDLSRQVIQQGSILTYQIDSPLSETDKQKLQQGLGAYREMGLGQLVPLQESKWKDLIQSSPKLSKPEDKKKRTASSDSPLLKTLKTRKTQIEARSEIDDAVEAAIYSLCQKMQNIRRYLGIGKQPVGPTKTQWGMIRDLVTKTQFASSDEVCNKLFEGKNAPIPENDEIWKQTDGSGSFRDWLKARIQHFDNEEKNQEIKKIKLNLYLRTLARAIAENATLQKVQQGQLDSCQDLQPKKGEK